MMKLWISCEKFTCEVETDNQTGTVTEACPCLKRFIGQPWPRIIQWASHKGWNPEWKELP